MEKNKIIHLQDVNLNWHEFNYSENLIEELKSVIEKGEYLFGNRAIIGNRAKIGDGATIGDGVIILKSFYLSGTKHSVTYVGDGKINIGCFSQGEMC